MSEITLPSATVQQVLDALEESEQHYGSDSALRDAIQTLRAVLEQPEQEPVAWSDARLRGIASDYFPEAKDWPAAMLCLRHLLMEQAKYPPASAPQQAVPYAVWRQGFDAVRKYKQQPQQAGPVEIKPPNPEGATLCTVRWWAETPAGWVGAWDREALEQFAHPPRREWRSLSEKEIGDVLPHEPGDLDFVCARAIEAALKEKNHD
jgi:hypothetical protein